MYRVIIASGFDRYGGTNGNEYMSDEQIMWEEMKDAWQDACERWYNAILDAEDPRDLTYDQIVTYVADHAHVKYNVATYFVDQFLSWEPEPLPLKGSTQVSCQHKVQASDDQQDSEEELMKDYLQRIVSSIPGVLDIDLMNDWDHIAVDFEPTFDQKVVENQVVEAFKKEGYDPMVIRNTGSEIVLEIPYLENPEPKPLTFFS